MIFEHGKRCLNEKTVIVLLIACGIFGYLVGSERYDEFLANNQPLINTLVMGAAFMASFVIWCYTMKWWLDEIEYIFHGEEKIDFCKFLNYSGYAIFALGFWFAISYFSFYFVLIIIGLIMFLIGIVMPDRCRVCNTSEENTTLNKAESNKFYCDKCIETVSKDFEFIKTEEGGND